MIKIEHVSKETSEGITDIQLYECKHGERMIYQYIGKVFPHKESLPNKSKGDMDIIYIIAGNGIITAGHDRQTITQGDRITVSNKEDYIIINNSDIDIDYMIIGVKSK